MVEQFVFYSLLSIYIPCPFLLNYCVMAYRKSLQIWEMNSFGMICRYFFPVCHLSFDFVFWCFFFILWKISIYFFYLTFQFWFRLWNAFLFRDYFESSLFSSAALLWLYSLYTSFLLKSLGVSKHVYLIQALGNWSPIEFL